MALPTFYSTGTVSVLNGATTVTGSGTGWGGDVILPGDLFMDPAQPEIPPQRIAAVTDATHLELAVGWPGTDMSADPYEIRFVGDIVRSTAQSRRYLEMLGQLSALGIQPNAFGAFADRDAYDDEAAGFIFLSLDGDGETDVWTLYIKKSAAAGDWDDGQTIAGAEGRQGEPGPPGEQGAVGPANTLTIGTVVGGPVADAEITGTAPNQTLNLVLPQGDAGEDGWSPVFAIATDGARRVLQLAGYVGGTGTEPTDHVGEYVGASGYTSTIGDAVDIRGPQGTAGAGSGDMEAATYDPQGIEDDAFDRANHTGTQSADTITDGTTNKAFTATEKTKLSYISVTQAVDLDALESAVVPAGGTTGQVLKKASNADNDTVWEDESGGSVGNNLSIAGDQDLSVSPTGNTTSTSSSLSVQATTAEASKREFLANFGLVSNLGNGLGTPTEDKVALYAGVQGQAGTGAIWAGNFLARLDASSGDYSANGIEIDLDNLNAHRGDSGLGAPSVWGLNISGASTFRSTGAILVSGATDQWNRGIVFANDALVKATFVDLCNADVVFDIQGSHVNGLDLSAATFSGYAVSLGSGQVISWDSGDVTITHAANTLTFSGAETAYTFQSDEVSGSTDVRIINNADDAATTKLMALKFFGRDTINTLKEVGRIEAAPPNANWVGADIKHYVRAASGEAMTEVLRLGSDLTVKALAGGLGYGTGAGGTITQATSKSTGVTLNKPTGQITMNNAALTANTTVSFTLTNSAIAAGDLLVLNHISGGTAGSYALNAQCAAGSASINVRNITAGSLSEAIVISFAVIKGATA